MSEDSQSIIYNGGLRFKDEIVFLPSEPYQDVTKEDLSSPKFRDCKQASHVVIYADTNKPVIRVFNPKAAILMQIRCDGYLGFPGGLVDDKETPEDAVNRELLEESGLTPGMVHVTDDDKLVVHYSRCKNLLLHMYAKKVPLETFCEVERRSVTNAGEWANEVMGITRVPLYTMSDGFRGFPAFLGANFVGNAKEQLLTFLEVKGLLKKDEIQKALCAKPLKIGKLPDRSPTADQM